MSNPNFGKYARRGGIASGQLQRGWALDRYREADPHCLECGKELLPPDHPRKLGYRRNLSTAAKRHFCCPTCAANFRWKKIRKETGRSKPKKSEPMVTTTPFKMKKEVSPKMINQHAKKVYFSHRKAVCEECGINNENLIDVCHIKAISKFEDTSLLLEINQLSNLKGLCKNCHWLFDACLPGRKGNKKASKTEVLEA